MVIALVHSGSARATSGTVTATMDGASTGAAGNLLVACFGWNGSTSTFPVPSGWLLVKQWAGASGLAAIWMKQPTAGETALSVTPATGNQYDLHLAEFSGLAVPTVDKTAKADSGTTQVTTITSESTGALSGSGDLIIACAAVVASASAPVWSGGVSTLKTTARFFSGWGVDTDQTPKTPSVSWTTVGRAAMAVGVISPAFVNASFTGWGVPA